MERWQAPAPVDWLERLGFSAQSDQVDEAHLDYFQDSDHMVVFSQKGQEVWLGLGVSHLFNKLCQSQDFKGLGAGVAMVADDAHGYYGFQEFARGAAGWGAQVTTAPPSMWMRPASQRNRKPPAHHGDPVGCRSFGRTGQCDRSLRDGAGRRRGLRHRMAWADARLGFGVDGGSWDGFSTN